MSYSDDLSTTFYRLLFPVVHPASRARPREFHGVAAKEGLSPTALYCYLGLFVLAAAQISYSIYKIYGVRKSSKEKRAQAQRSIVPRTTQSDLFASVKGALPKGMYYELKTQGLTQLGQLAPRPTSGDDDEDDDDSVVCCPRDQLGGEPGLTQIQYKQTSPGPGVIKLLIKRPQSSSEREEEEDFQDSKRRLLYPLTSPAKQAKRDRRKAAATGNADAGKNKTTRREGAGPREPEDEPTSEDLYNTARALSGEEGEFEEEEEEEKDADGEKLLERVALGKSSRGESSRDDHACPEPPAKPSPKRRKNKSPRSKSPKKRRKLKPYQRSIFSRSGRSRKEVDRDHPVGEAESLGSFLRSMRGKGKVPPSGTEDQLPTTARSKFERSVSGRAASAKRQGSRDVFSPQSPAQAESAARELQSLIRQVQYENRPRRSVSPRSSMSFLKSAGKTRSLSHRPGKADTGDPPSGKKPTRQGDRPMSVSVKQGHPPNKAAALSRDSCYRSKSSSRGDEALSSQVSSGQQSKSEDHDCCTKGVSLSILTRIASMQSAGEDDSSAPRTRRKNKKLHERQPSKKPRAQEQQTSHEEAHVAFVKAPVYEKDSSPSPRQEPPRPRSQRKLPAPGGYNQPLGVTCDSSILTHKRAGRKQETEDLSSGELSNMVRTRVGLTTKKRPSVLGPTAARVDHRVAAKHQGSPGGRWYGRQSLLLAPTTRSQLPLTRGRTELAGRPRAKPLEPVSASQAPQYSCLGCIVPSDSTTARETRDGEQRPPQARKLLSRSTTTQRRAGKAPQPIEGYILNSKTPIANTLLLCRSGVTTTYEKWAREMAHGTGAVKACSGASGSNRFPSLSSYLDFLERKTASVSAKHRQKVNVKPRENEHEDLDGQKFHPEVKEGKDKIDQGVFEAPSESTFNKIIVNPHLNGETSDVGNLKRASDIPEQKNQHAVRKNADGPTRINELEHAVVPNFNKRFKGHLGSDKSKKVEPKQTKPDGVKKDRHSTPNLKKEDERAPPNRKLKYAYLPLKRQSLPNSSASQKKVEAGKDSLNLQQKQPLSSPERPQKKNEETSTTIIEKPTKKPAKNVESPGTERLSPSVKHKTDAEPSPRDALTERTSPSERERSPKTEPRHSHVATPIVTNLKKFSVIPRPRLKQGNSRPASPEKPKLRSSVLTANKSAGETSGSVDLQSLLEMAKVVLKKPRGGGFKTRNKEAAVGTCIAGHKTKPDLEKSDGQASASSRGKCSPSPQNLGTKDPEGRNVRTPEGASYTHLYKMSETRGVRPWRTTKAFTNRLKLMLQRNKEDCMRRKAEKAPKTRRERKAQKAYVVHKAVPPGGASGQPKNKKESVELGEAMTMKAKDPVSKTALLDPSKLQATKGQMSAKLVVGSTEKGTKSFQNGPPKLRTEALAKKRRKSADSLQTVPPAISALQSKKKKFKSKGTPLKLTTRQLCSESREDCSDAFMVHYANSGLREGQVSPVRVQLESPTLSDSLRRKLPATGIDPAQAARLHQNALSSSIIQDTQPLNFLSRASKAQGDLFALLGKMQARDSCHGLSQGQKKDKDNGLGPCKKQAREGEQRGSGPPPRGAVMITELAKDEPGRTGSHENVTPESAHSLSWKLSGSGKIPEVVEVSAARDAGLPELRASETLLVHSELDPELSPSALKSLLQCACSKFHSMPHLLSPRTTDVRTMEKADRRGEDWRAISDGEHNQDEDTLVESICRNPSRERVSSSTTVVSGAAAESKNRSAEQTSDHRQRKLNGRSANAQEPSGQNATASQNFVLETRDLCTNKSSMESSTDPTKIKKSLTHLPESNKNVRTVKAKPVTDAKSAGKAHLKTRRNTPRSRKAKMTITSPTFTSKMANGLKASKSLSNEEIDKEEPVEKGPNRTLKMPHNVLANGAEPTKKLTTKDVHFEEVDYIYPIDEDFCRKPQQVDSSPDILTRAHFPPAVCDASKEASQFKEPLLCTDRDMDQSTMSDTELVSDDVRGLQAEASCAELYVGAGHGVRFGHQHGLTYDSVVVVSPCLNSTSLLTSSTLNFTEISEHDACTLPESVNDLELQSSKKSADNSQTTVLEKGGSITSGYATADASSSSGFSRKAKLFSHSTAAFSIAASKLSCSQTESEALGGSALSDEGSRGSVVPVESKASCDMMSPRAVGQVSARKVLSHITEESDHSEVHAELEPKVNVWRGYRVEGDQRANGADRAAAQRICTLRVTEATAPELESPDTRGTVEATGSVKIATDVSLSLTRKLHALPENTSEDQTLEASKHQGSDFFREVCSDKSFPKVPEVVSRHFHDGEPRDCIDHDSFKGIPSTVTTDTSIDETHFKTKQDEPVFDNKYCLDGVPVTIIYTTQTSEVPEVSFTNEDEVSLDSWTQESACQGKKSLDSDHNVQIKEDEKEVSEGDEEGADEPGDVLLPQASVREIHGTCCKSVGSDEIAASKTCSLSVEDGLPGNTEDRSDYSNIESVSKPHFEPSDPHFDVDGRTDELPGQCEDLESLLDSALDTSFTSRSHLVFPRACPRRSRDRRVGRRVAGSSGDSPLGQGQRLQGSRESEGAQTQGADSTDNKVSVQKATGKPPRSSSGEGTRLDHFLKKAGINSPKPKGPEPFGRGRTRPDDASSLPGCPLPGCPRADVNSREEQTLTEILREVPTQPFLAARNRKSRKGELKVENEDEIKQEMHVFYTSEKTLQSHRSKGNDSRGAVKDFVGDARMGDAKHNSSDATLTESQRPSEIRPVSSKQSAPCVDHPTTRGGGGDSSESCLSQTFGLRGCEHGLADKNRDSSAQSNDESGPCLPVPREPIRDDNRDSGNSSSPQQTQKSSGKRTNDSSLDSISKNHRETSRPESSENRGKLLFEENMKKYQMRENISGLGGETKGHDSSHALTNGQLQPATEDGVEPSRASSPSASSSSSIVLSWVGSHEESDQDAGYTHRETPENVVAGTGVAGVEEGSVAPGSKNGRDDPGPALVSSFKDKGFGMSPANLELKDSMSPKQRNGRGKAKNISPKGIAGFNFRGNMRRGSDKSPGVRTKVGTTNEQNNSNKNRPRPGRNTSSFDQRLAGVLGSTTAPAYNEEGDGDVNEGDDKGTESSSSWRLYPPEDNDFLNSNGLDRGRENCGILEQQSYLHSLVLNPVWDEEVSCGGWAKDIQGNPPSRASRQPPPGQTDARCGYVMSAWTNQHLHGDLTGAAAAEDVDTTLMRRTCRAERVAEVSNTTSHSASVDRTRDSRSHHKTDSIWTTRRSTHVPARKPQAREGAPGFRGRRLFCSKISTTFGQKNVGCETGRPRQRPSIVKTPDVLVKTDFETSYAVSPVRHASLHRPVSPDEPRPHLSLEEHLRRQSQSLPHSDRYLSDGVGTPASDSGRQRPFRSLTDHLSAMSEAVTRRHPARYPTDRRDGQGDHQTSQSPSSHSSLNWYRPQSLSSSNSLSNSQAGQPRAVSRPPLESTAHRNTSEPRFDSTAYNNTSRLQFESAAPHKTAQSQFDSTALQTSSHSRLATAGDSVGNSQREYHPTARTTSVRYGRTSDDAYSTESHPLSSKQQRLQRTQQIETATTASTATVPTTTNARAAPTLSINSRSIGRAPWPNTVGVTNGNQQSADGKKVSKIVEMFEMKRSAEN